MYIWCSSIATLDEMYKIEQKWLIILLCKSPDCNQPHIFSDSDYEVIVEQRRDKVCYEIGFINNGWIFFKVQASLNLVIALSDICFI